MNRQEILEILKKYPFPKEELIIISGAALVLLDIKEKTGDIDFAVTKRLYEDLLKNYSCVFEKYNRFGNAVYFMDSVINFGIDYIDVPFVKVESYQVQTPESIKQLKLSLKRPKDTKDIELIEEWEKRHG